MGHTDVQPVLGMAMCHPSVRQPDCRVCLRYRSTREPAPEDRLSVVIDATVLKGDGCAMFSHAGLTRQAA